MLERNNTIGLLFAAFFLSPFPSILSLSHSFFSDGWTMNDLIYRWKDTKPVQMAANLSLPGGFKLDNFQPQSCDVITATGKVL